MRDNESPGQNSRGPEIRRGLATLLMLMSASCSSSLENGAPLLTYVVLTDAGPILIDADGFAHGFTQSALEDTVRTGVKQGHRGQIKLLEADEFMPTRRMLFHVEEGFRPTRAQITMELFFAGQLVKSVSTASPEPGAFPEAVFIHSIADLTRRLLPPVALNVTPLLPSHSPT